MSLASGVVAAFECKNTLKAKHIKDAVESCKTIKGLYLPQTGTPFKELQAPILYGLLAHSHSWKSPSSTPVENIQTTVLNHELQNTQAPSELLDLICVADLATWLRIKLIFFGTEMNSRNAGHYGDICTVLGLHAKKSDVVLDNKDLTPIGSLIGGLF
jgi:hypothetical protein